jgi:hypothetical protein
MAVETCGIRLGQHIYCDNHTQKDTENTELRDARKVLCGHARKVHPALVAIAVSLGHTRQPRCTHGSAGPSSSEPFSEPFL